MGRVREKNFKKVKNQEKMRHNKELEFKEERKKVNFGERQTKKIIG